LSLRFVDNFIVRAPAMHLSPLPIDSVLHELVEAFGRGARSVVLEAPPGAGKTTRVPRALLDMARSPNGSPDAPIKAPSRDSEILVLEPRRIAARLAARRVAEELGERVGQTVGYTVRFEDVSSPSTRIRFVTEGIVTRKLVSDPLLRGVSTVVLDEFHERHLHGDVTLALLKKLQHTQRPDLRLVVMSATLDAAPVADFLACDVIRSEGRCFDVAIDHLPAPDDRKLELQVASAIRTLVRDGLSGHALVFLPGAAEIRAALSACEPIAREHDLALVALHGDLPPAEQDRAVAPSAKRKVIVSTNLAESSVTIDGVVAVVDSGLVRSVRHAPWSGIATSTIEKTSRASAIQRAGRAGRTQPGRALRLFTKGDFDTRNMYDTPEIHRADLAQTVLELAAKNIAARELHWLDPPKAEHLIAAETLLCRLGAVKLNGPSPSVASGHQAVCALTDTGARMLAFPVHPRQARIVVEAERRGVGDDGALIAALLGERDIRLRSKSIAHSHGGSASHAASGTWHGPPPNDLATEPSDVLHLVDRYKEADASGFAPHTLRALALDARAVQSVHRAHMQMTRILRPARTTGPETLAAADQALMIAILAGFPDRVARRVKAGSRGLALAQGSTAELSEQSVVRDAPWLVAVDAEVLRGRTVVRLASEIDPTYLIELFEDSIREVSELTFDEAKGEVTGASRMLYDALTIAESGGFDSNDPRVADLLFQHATSKARGAQSLLHHDGQLQRFIARSRFASSQDPSIQPLTDDRLATILRGCCAGKTSLRQVFEIDLVAEVRAALGGLPRLDELAPERVTLASGRTTTVEYEDGKPPFIASYLQDFMGTVTSPRAGRIPLVIHLLAPNKRPVQVTTDLPGFWQKHYPSIRKELMRKYPRHAWPEDTSQPIAMRPARR